MKSHGSPKFSIQRRLIGLEHFRIGKARIFKNRAIFQSLRNAPVGLGDSQLIGIAQGLETFDGCIFIFNDLHQVIEARGSQDFPDKLVGIADNEFATM